MQNKNQANITSSLVKQQRIYIICLLISAIFFLLFGLNSPLFAFNYHPDYQWYKTMGNGLLSGKIPYRDLFEHKGPIVYFVTAFCCLFPDPDFAMLIIEIISMSLFLFFAYRIFSKKTNTFFSFMGILALILAIFITNASTRSGSTIEEFSLPIYTYFLFCWFEFMEDKLQWKPVRSFCIGLCFGLILWTKFTLFAFLLVPMVVWFFVSIHRRQIQSLIKNIAFIILGIITITTPILIFYAVHHAMDDLFYVYFFINITAYRRTNEFFECIKLFFKANKALIFLILWGVIRTTIKNWRIGKYILISFIVSFFLIAFSCNIYTSYYFVALNPYAILGIIDIIELIKNGLYTPQVKKFTYAIIILLCFILSTTLTSLIWEHQQRKEYSLATLTIANLINHYRETTQTNPTLLCYEIMDIGIYNSANIIPNNYFFAKNNIPSHSFPQIKQSAQASIKNQTSDFLVMPFYNWLSENDFLFQYYQPYISEISDTYVFPYPGYYNGIVLLIKKDLIS